MGFFSWKTQDTDKSIANSYSIRNTFKVDMIDDKGNVWTENNYEGYGTFGGKDYYELLAEMNGAAPSNEGDYTEDMRIKGINIAFKNNGSGEHTKGVKYPNLVEEANGWLYNELGPETCDDQGFFYAEEEEEEEEYLNQ